MFKNKELKQQADIAFKILTIQDELLFALVREHPEVWESIIENKELSPYAKMLRDSLTRGKRRCQPTLNDTKN